MKIITGILGYLLLIISGAFIDAPIISIFVIPLFLIGAVLLIVFHIKLIPMEQENSWLKIIFIAGVTLIGTLLLFFGVRTIDKTRQSSIFLILLPAILLVPLTLLFIKITILTGIWLGG